MDIKEKITEIVEKLKNDKNLMSNFKTNPIQTIENLIGVDLPNETIEKVIDGVKAKISIDDSKAGISKITGLFK
jgi:hypothetical protein